MLWKENQAVLVSTHADCPCSPDVIWDHLVVIKVCPQWTVNSREFSEDYSAPVFRGLIQADPQVLYNHNLDLITERVHQYRNRSPVHGGAGLSSTVGVPRSGLTGCTRAERWELLCFHRAV